MQWLVWIFIDLVLLSLLEKEWRRSKRGEDAKQVYTERKVLES
jgi:hypothetical protein